MQKLGNVLIVNNIKRNFFSNASPDHNISEIIISESPSQYNQ